MLVPRDRLAWLALLCAWAAPPAWAQTPAGSAFTYQGRLESAGSPANGSFDFQFVLYDALAGGTQVGPVVNRNAVTVSNGVFTVKLDFGASAFSGDARWLEVGVRPAGGGPFTVLAPRQELTPGPHALYALSIPLAGSGAAATAAHSDHDHAGSYAALGHTHSGADVTSGSVGPLFGGTGQTAWATGDLLFASATNTLARRAVGTSGQVLSVSGGLPSWANANGHDHLGQAWSTTTAQYGLQIANGSAMAGAALRGTHSGSSGPSYGVQGVYTQTIGGSAGVFGEAQGATGATYGVLGFAASTNGFGVFGVASATSGDTSGVFGQANSTIGHGVLGFASAATGITSGVFGQANSTAGRGVYGLATASFGTTFGVFGTVNSPDGWGLYTPNRAYVGSGLGIGTVPVASLDVIGQGRFVAGSGSPPLLIPTPYAAGQTVVNLSADLLDGQDSTAFATAAHAHSAADITSGTLAPGRLAGVYTGVTGVGTVTSGTWNANPIGPVFGGTGQISWAAGDLLFANAANSLGRLAIGTSGKILTSAGGLPAWGNANDHDHLGQTWSATSGQYGLNVTSTSSTFGAALRGVHSGSGGASYGVLGVNTQTSAGASGVFGDAQGPTGTTFGVLGQASSSAGTGVYGQAVSLTGTTYGVSGYVNSPDGWGLYTPNRAHVGYRLGIGTTSPTTPLDVAGQGRFTAPSGVAPLVVPVGYVAGATVTNLSADLLDGLDSTAFATPGQLASYVAKAGDTMTGALNITSLGTSLAVTNHATVGGSMAIGPTTLTTSLVTLASGATPELDFTAGDTVEIRSQNDMRVGTWTTNDMHLMANGANRLTVDGATGNVGIGTLFPSFRLDVESSLGIVAEFNKVGSDGPIVQFSQDGTPEGNISVSGTTVSYNAFTGSHYAWTKAPIERGQLVSLTGENKHLYDRAEAEPIYGVVPASRANDPAVLGAYLGRLEPGRPQAPVTENPHLVAAVGNGELWVADMGEDISAGDGLVSSEVPGHAMKDSERFPVSYVVARAAEPVRWREVTQSAVGVRHRKISVLFESHVREKTTVLARAVAARDAEIAELRKTLAAQAAAIEALRSSLRTQALLASRVERLERRHSSRRPFVSGRASASSAAARNAAACRKNAEPRPNRSARTPTTAGAAADRPRPTL